MKRIYCIVFVLALFLPTLQHGLNIFPSPTLMGVEEPPPKHSWSVSGWLDGTYQVQYEKRRASRIGLRGYFVKTYNQLHYSLFHRVVSSSGTRMVIGKENWIYEKPYIRKVNARSRDKGVKAEKAVELLARLQQNLSKLGVNFVFVVAPSKAEVYQEFVPPHLLKDPLPAGIKTDYQYVQDALKQHGVNYVDTHGMFMREKQAKGYHLFGPSGVHWNKYGAYLVWKEIDHVVKDNLKVPFLFPVLVSVEKQPSDIIDADLGALLNLWDTELSTPLTDYPVFGELHDKKREKPSLLIIGDSFMFTLIDTIKRANLSSDVDAWYYFKRHYTYPAEDGQLMDLIHAIDTPMSEEQVDWQNQLLKKDLVILVQTQLWLPKIGFGFIQAALKETEQILQEQQGG